MYKVIDGIVYQQVDVSDMKAAIDKAVSAARPYVDGIKTCNEKINAFERQIDSYEEQIQQIVINSKLDIALVRLIAPDKAAYLNIE